MRFIFSEYQADYSKYHFPYQVYLIRESKDSLEEIYNMGFLPSRIRKNLFYLARSLRVDLEKFEPSSENRRILKKTEYLSLEVVSLEGFKYSFEIGKMGKDFYDKRFGKGVMSANKIKWLFTSGSCTDVIVYKDGDQVIGYCPILKTDNLVHYAYPFYKLAYFEKNAGMGMMLKGLMWAKEQGLKHMYLGTCYTESSLYKTQFEGAEYFDGFEWNSDIDELKKAVRNKRKGHLLEEAENKEEVFAKSGTSCC